MHADDLITLSGRLLGYAAQDWNATTVRLIALVPDGSNRRFFQLVGPVFRHIAVLPPEGDGQGAAEARSFFQIGTHLQQAGAPVPLVQAFDPDSHLAICEDLGAQRLFELVADQGAEAALAYYEQAVERLARMQILAAEGFDPNWCWDTGRYDAQVMLERESGYFLRACCTDLLGIEFDRVAVGNECARLAAAAAEAPAHFFLHRDFQSRNLMITAGQVRFIDFQGGRLGPLAYDLASLLLDPYTQLPQPIQTHLMHKYLTTVQTLIPYPAGQFHREYFLLALQRNLQIAGAFSFLSQVRRKPFFAQFIGPALASLSDLLAKPEAAGYVYLRDLVNQCRREFACRK